ncbi:MAG TPA: PAS domain-containing protein [Candidatus Limnocylindrales bacterium]|nr:PAS domain-containing protein [Candidatus Limnocylindrales bacterium]
MSTRPVEPALITIPASDAAFREHVHGLVPLTTPRELEQRLRRIFPRVVVRERMISGAPGWYVYRDGSWSSSLVGDWWDDPHLPRVVLSADGWNVEANATGAGLLGMDVNDVASHHFTDFVMPGTLDDSMGLFRIVLEGKPLDATVLVRPLTGDVIAVDIHAHLVGDRIVGVFRLADDVDVPSTATVVGRPVSISYVPATDVAFRVYAQRALDRMPEATPEGLALRLRRLYPHASVREDGDLWTAQRDHDGVESSSEPWWRGPDTPRVRYDAQALILEANEQAEAFFGRSMVGHHWQEFVTPGSTDQVGVMLEILAEVGAAESRFRMPHGDGRLLEFDSYTEVHGEDFVTMFRQADVR